MKTYTLIFTSLSAALLFFFTGTVEPPKEASLSIEAFLDEIEDLPRYMEAGYSPLGRSPVVDMLLENPRNLPQYAAEVAETIKTSQTLYNLESALFRAGGIPVTPLPEADFTASPPAPFLDAFSPSAATTLYGLWREFKATASKAARLLSVLSPEEKEWIKTHYFTFFFGTQDPTADYDFFTTDSPYPLKFFELASRLDLAQLTDCATTLCRIADTFDQHRHEFEPTQLKEDFRWEEEELKLIVSTQSNATHKEDADFFIDLGGHNTFHNNAGGTQGTRSLALHLDLKGHNSYQGGNFVQGAGFLGVGLFASCAGHNTFTAHSYSQGCGLFGVGLLVNKEGDNRFSLNFGGQSFALFGASLLWNAKGHNDYIARQGMAQAATSTMGVAFLVDNEGHNTYLCGTPGKGIFTRYGGMGQGGSSGVRGFPWLNNPSFYGGLSYLYIGGGNNQLKTVWLGQGSAYFLGVGILVEEGSNDLFEAEVDSQGQGLHLAGGLLLRKGNNGHFKGGWGSLGVGADRSIGAFINTGDSNYFEGTVQSVGTSRKPKAVGLFANFGGNNIYKFESLSNTRLQFPGSPIEWSHALFLEVGEGSHYPENVDEFVRGSSREWGLPPHSLGFSLPSSNLNVKELFFKTSTPPRPSNTFFRPLDLNRDHAERLANEIGQADYDRRRQIYETLDLLRFQNRTLDYDLSYLLKEPTRIETDAFNYGVLWALRNKAKLDLEPIKKALATDGFPSNYARKMAVSLTGLFGMPDSAPLLCHIMLNDTSDEVRYYAAYALALNLSPATIDFVKQGLKSDSEVVRFAIAHGLEGSGNLEALPLATSLFNDPSFYVRRAAGFAALSLGDESGVPIILETLQYPTLDTEENYGDNVFQRLSTYLGVDLGLDKEAWIQWWNTR